MNTDVGSGTGSIPQTGVELRQPVNRLLVGWEHAPKSIPVWRAGPRNGGRSTFPPAT
jgi:hypothetical protein